MNLECPLGEVQVLSFASLPAGACEWSVDPPTPPTPPATAYQPITDERRNRSSLPARRCSRVGRVHVCSLDLGVPAGGTLLYCKDATSRVHGPLELLYADGSARSQMYCSRGEPRGMLLTWVRGLLFEAYTPGDPGIRIWLGKYRWGPR